jgi:hypothetical protein
MFVGVGWATVEAPSPGERRRVARWNSRAGELRHGQLSPERFRRLVGAWSEFRGEGFESTPNRVLATLEERSAAGEELFEYTRRRP